MGLFKEAKLNHKTTYVIVTEVSSAGWHNGNALGLYSEDVQFHYRSQHQLYLLRISVVLHSLSVQMLGDYLDRPLEFHNKSFPTHHSLIYLPFGTINSRYASVVQIPQKENEQNYKVSG